MSHTLKINVNGSGVIDMGAGTSYSVSKFVPRHPKQSQETGEYDLVTPIEDEIEIIVIGSSSDNLADKISLLDKTLHDASRYFKDKSTGYLTEMEWKPQGATNSVTTEVFGGWVDYPDDFLGAPVLGRVIEGVKVHIVHRPIWEGAAQVSGSDFTFTASVADNGATNFCTIPALKGDLDARVKIKYVGASGNIANCDKVIAAVRANGTPTNFIHILKVANVSGYTITADPGSTGKVAITAETDYLSGSKLRLTPTVAGDADTEFKLAQWNITSNVADQYGRFWVVVRYRDSHSTPNFALRFRGGLSDGTNIAYGAYTTETKVKTRYNTASSTELGLLDLGLITVPSLGGQIDTNYQLVYELLATPLSNNGHLSIDYIMLFPVGEVDNGNGICVAEFNNAFTSKWLYLDSRLRKDTAYVSNTSDVKVYSPLSLPSGGEIRLRPSKAGQRVYFTVCSRTSGYGKHDIDNTADVSMTVIPQYFRIKGTT